jgi:hypothetical protein
MDGGISEPRTTRAALRGVGAQTRLMTSFGMVPAQLLRRGDSLRTANGNYAKVASVRALRFDAGFLQDHDFAHPVLVSAKALGRSLPERNAVFAPDEVLRLRSPSGERKDVRAHELASKPHVYRAPMAPLTYYEIRCEEPVTAMAEGIEIVIEGVSSRAVLSQ